MPATKPRMQPRLDDRSMTEVVEQCQDLATRYTPAWSGAATPGDPGHEMVQLFARLMELLTGRLNKVPDKNFLSFLEMVGVEQFAGAPARAPVTFVPSKKAVEGGEVPARTQVATTQTETADAQVFETLDAFHVTPAQLLRVVNVVPESDGYSLIQVPESPPSIEALNDADSAVTILSPSASTLEDLPHALFIGSEVLFGRDEAVDVTVTLQATAGGDLLNDSNLVFKRYSSELEEWIPISGSAPVVTPAVGSVELALPGVESFEASEVGGIEDFWIAVECVADLSGGSRPTISSASGTLGPTAATAPQAEATAAFYNATELDLSKPFLPFGERPRYGDAFYIASDVALTDEVSAVTLQFDLLGYGEDALKTIFANTPTGGVTLETLVEWQYLSDDGDWLTLDVFKRTQSIGSGTIPTINSPTVERGQPLGASTVSEDGTLFGSGTDSVQFQLSLGDMGRAKLNGVESYWIRALIKSQDPYGQEGSLIPGSPPTFFGPTFVPPVVEQLALTYSYKAEPEFITRVAIANNLQSEAATFGSGVAIFEAPQAQVIDSVNFFAVQPTLYLAFDRPFGNRYISLFFLLEEAPATLSSPLENGDPQIAWEYLDLDGTWRSLDVLDRSENLTTSGTVSFLAPAETLAAKAMPLLFEDAELEAPIYWYRARLAGGSYDYPPQLLGVFPNTTLSENAQTDIELLVGSGNGEPGQEVALVRKPVLDSELWVREPEIPAEPELSVLSEEHAESVRTTDDADPRSAGSSEEIVDSRSRETGELEHWVRWLRVPNFLSSGPRSRHYSLDAVNGRLLFGDGEQGLIPPLDKDNLVMRNLVGGGGEEANVVATTLAIKELKSSLPFVDKVFNVQGAVGGADSWTLDNTMEFGPQVVKNRGRAVSIEDYEWMVRERFSEVGKVTCLPTTQPLPLGGLGFRPGAITMIVVPKSSKRLPRPSNGLLRAIEEFLERNVLGTIVSEVYAVGPDFKTVEIHASVSPADPRHAAGVVRRAGEELASFFHPLDGGERGQGWTFGRSVHISEILAVLERTTGVDFVRSASFAVDPLAASLAVGSNQLVASGIHQIEAV